MGGLIDIIKGVLRSIGDIIGNILEHVWDDIVKPIVEEVVGIFGIEDELVIQVSKVSTKLYGSNVEAPSKNAITQAVLGKARDDNKYHSYFDHYWYQINTIKVSVTSYYRYGLNQFVYGVPDATIHGTSIDMVAVQDALTLAKGASSSLKEATSTYPTPLRHFQDVLQLAPYLYRPAVDMLTYTDSTSGISYDDWSIADVFFNVGNTNYEVTLTRQAAIAEFWITGDANVVEGKNASYTIHSTRIIPAGVPLTINLVYGGSAPSGDYSAVVSVQMLEGNSEVSFSVGTIDNTAMDGSREFTVAIGVIDNSQNIFQAVGAIVPSTLATLVHDEDLPMLFVGDELVDEEAGSVGIGVKLLNTPGVGFTVDYTTVAVTATAGADYTTTAGTLTFVGTLNEVQGITVPILTDLADDSGETFNIVLSNCSNGSVNIASQGIVTIVDSSAGNPPSATVTTSEVLIQPDFTREYLLVVKYFDSITDPLALDWHYWMYDLSLGTYTGLDPISNTTTNLELFPIAVLRKDKVSITDSGNAANIKSTKNLLKRLNLPLEDIVANFEESPDLDKMQDAYINIGVNPTDTGHEVAKLLYHLFYPVIVETPADSNQQKFYLTVEQDNIQNAVVWSAQSYTPSIVGTIGVEGTYAHEVTESSLVVRYQVNATQYDEIGVETLNGLATIDYGVHHHIAGTRLGDENFTIPVSWFSLNQLTPKEQMDVYDKIVRLDFYAVWEVEIDWYATEAFMTFFQVVLIVITIASFGAAAPATAGAATAATATASQVAIAVARQVAINYLTAQVVSVIAKATGNEALAAVVGVAMAIAFAPGGTDFGNLFSKVDAKTLLDLSTDFAKNIGDAYKVTSSVDAEKLYEDITELTELAEERLESFEDAQYTPAVDAEFLALMRSVDTTYVPAISGIYAYDTIYNYDRIISDYHDNLLLIGVA